MITEPYERKVLFALELVDPFDGRIVSHGIRVEAKDAHGRPTGRAPIVSQSGRFVWLDRKEPHPATVGVESRDLPYASQDIPIPATLPTTPLIRERLRPRRDYPLPRGVCAMRGYLFRTVGQDEKRVAITGALVQMAWKIADDDWIPPWPQAPAPLRFGECLTDAAGEFIVFSCPPKDRTKRSDYLGQPPSDQPDLMNLDTRNGWPPAVRLQVTRFDIHAKAWTDQGCDRDSSGEFQSAPLLLDWKELRPQ